MSSFGWLKDYVAVIAAVIAAIASMATLVLNTVLTFRREQRKSLWEQELARFLELEEAAGKLTEELSTYELRISPEGQANFWKQYNWMKAATGRFRRYSAVHEALREFHLCAAAFYQVDKRTGQPKEYDEKGERLEAAYKALLKASDEATNRPGKREA